MRGSWLSVFLNAEKAGGLSPQLFTRNLQALILWLFPFLAARETHVNSVGYIMQDTQQQLCI
jgi:hypothetical protein